MLTEQEVLAIWEARRKMVKPFYFSTGGFRWNLRAGVKREEAYSWDYEIPELWPGYNASCREATRIRPHVQHGFYPADLFAKRAPNETPEEAEYGRCNFKQTTLADYQDCENMILRALHESNFTVDFGGKETPFQDYVTNGLKEFGSVINYVTSIIPRIKTIDAMGVIAILPDAIKTVEVEYAEGEVVEVIDPNEPLEPLPTYFPVNDVWGFEYDKWYLFRTHETSWVQSYKREKTGMIFMLVDDENVWKISQTGAKGEFTFEITLWFSHGLGFAPCIHLQGTPIVEDGNTRWQSYYLAAVEHFDAVLLDEDYLRKMKAKCVFPHKVMLGEDCMFVDEETGKQCFNGHIIWADENGTEHAKLCPKCRGGLRSRMGPLGEFLIRPGDRTTGNTEIANVSDALSFVSPTADMPKLLREEIGFERDQGRAMLHLKSEQPIAGGDAATATEVGVGVRSQQAFIKPIADQIFDILEFIYLCTGRLREGSGFKAPVVSRPSTYDVRTDAEMQQEFAASTNLLPPVVVNQLLWNMLLARFGHNPKTVAMYETIAAADRIFSMPALTINSRLQQRLIEPWQVTLHDQAVNLYDQLERYGKLTMDVQKDAEQLIAAAKAVTPATTTPAAERLALTVAR